MVLLFEKMPPRESMGTLQFFTYMWKNLLTPLGIGSRSCVLDSVVLLLIFLKHWSSNCGPDGALRSGIFVLRGLVGLFFLRKKLLTRDWGGTKVFYLAATEVLLYFSWGYQALILLCWIFWHGLDFCFVFLGFWVFCWFVFFLVLRKKTVDKGLWGD